MFNRLFGRPDDFSMVEVVFISKDDCHLCEVALRVVEDVRLRYRFQLRTVKIVPGDEWHDLYREKIPVVLIDGRLAFKYRVDADELVKKLRAGVRGDR